MYPTFSSDVWSEENVENLFGFHHFHVIINDPKEVYPAIIKININEELEVSGIISYSTFNCVATVSKAVINNDEILLNEEPFKGVSSCEPSQYIIKQKKERVVGDKRTYFDIKAKYDNKTFLAEITNYKFISNMERNINGVASLAGLAVGLTAGALFIKWMFPDSSNPTNNRSYSHQPTFGTKVPQPNSITITPCVNSTNITCIQIIK